MKLKTIGGRKISQGQQTSKSKIIHKSLKNNSIVTKELKDIKQIQSKDQFIIPQTHVRKKNSIVNQRHTAHDDTFESQDAFIDCIDDYIDRLDQGTSGTTNHVSKNRHNHSSSSFDRKLQNIEHKVKRQKQINKSLQKSVIEMQKVLWKRTEKLERLERAIFSYKGNKQNQQWQNISKSKLNIKKCYPTCMDDSEMQPGPQISIISGSSYDQPPRRKTQLPSEIQKIISQTLGLGSKRRSKHHFAKFL